MVLGQNYPPRIIGDKDPRQLREDNAAAIRRQRARYPECIDSGGYDLILVPRGSTLGHDGQRMRVFTKPEYRGASGKEPRGLHGDKAVAPRPKTGQSAAPGADKKRRKKGPEEEEELRGFAARRESLQQRTLREFVQRGRVDDSFDLDI